MQTKLDVFCLVSLSGVLLCIKTFVNDLIEKVDMWVKDLVRIFKKQKNKALIPPSGCACTRKKEKYQENNHMYGKVIHALGNN